MNFQICALACAAGLLAAGAVLAEDLPDLRRGQKAAEAGDFAGALRDLEPLAQLGYLAAQRELAELYAQQESPEALQQAIHWYRVVQKKDRTVSVALARTLLRTGDPKVLAEAEQFLLGAAQKGDARALAALIEIYTDNPERDPKKTVVGLVERAAKIDSPETESAAIRWYRRGPMPERYVEELKRRCVAARQRLPECYVDLARYHRIRGQKKPLGDLCAEAQKRFAAGGIPAPIYERLAWSLVSEDLSGEPQPETAHRMLKQVADRSAASPMAQVRLARLLVEYPQLDPNGNPEKLLRAALDQGTPEAALALGRLYMTGTRVTADPAQAQRYLQQAAETLPSAHYFLGRIYKRGELGRHEPELAAQHFLTAARSGHATADFALAQLFSDGRGVRVNRVNAYVFASLAVRTAVPKSAELLNQLQAAMTPQERQHADRLLRQEIAARQTAPAVTAGLQPRNEPESRP